jgi:galactokinase
METSGLSLELEERFGKTKEEIFVFFAPGRVNLIGEHTDYNGGYVLPCALNFGTYLAIRKNNSNIINMGSMNFPYTGNFRLDDIFAKKGEEWVNYPLGVLNQMINKGFSPEGIDMLFHGDIPNGAGLSSSASIELVTAKAINDLFGLDLDMLQMVKLSQKAENDFVGVNCGIMDQFAVGFGKQDKAIFLNCDTLEHELIPVELKKYKIVIANTNVRRGLSGSKYNERREECDMAVQVLRKSRSIRNLGELSLEEYKALENKISSQTVRKRARHVVSEDYRVLKAVNELKKGNLDFFGKLMNESHESLRDDYEVTGKELDTMVEEAWKSNGVLGSRMTGAGFGGCTVSIVKETEIDAFISAVGKRYEQKTNIIPVFYIAEIGDGTRKIGN